MRKETVIPEKATCTLCKLEKLVVEKDGTQNFYMDYRKKNGLGSWCRSCARTLAIKKTEKGKKYGESSKKDGKR